MDSGLRRNDIVGVEGSCMTLDDLEARIATRAAASPDDSYTAKLIARGMEKCAQKLGEEATEAVIAAVTGNRAELVKESADVLFHLLVVLKAAGIPLDEVMAELDARTAQSGLAEKASRTEQK
jgi:phosphoribosyl-ATP pyrophosphohydrolase